MIAGGLHDAGASCPSPTSAMIPVVVPVATRAQNRGTGKFWLFFGVATTGVHVT
jgi:hypothetical protein